MTRPTHRRARAWLFATIAMTSALALQVAAVRSTWCARAAAAVDGMRADDQRPDAPVLAADAAVAVDGAPGTCGGAVVVPGPPAPITFDFPEAVELAASSARAPTRHVPSGLERPPRPA